MTRQSASGATVMVAITVRRDDLEQAIEALSHAHADYCTSADTCSCLAIASRLDVALIHNND